MLQDVRYGLRVMARNPGFTAVSVLTLALGIGANAAIFSLVDAVLLRPLPYPNPEQLVGLGQWRNQAGEGYIQTGVSAPNIADIAKTGVFQFVACYRSKGFNVTQGNRPESVGGIEASAELLPMFGVQPQMGRFLTREETEAGHDQVAVIGHRLWQMRYGADPNILGKSIELDQKRYTIVGVMPASFRFTWDQETGCLRSAGVDAGRAQRRRARHVAGLANTSAAQSRREHRAGTGRDERVGRGAGSEISRGQQRLGDQSGATARRLSPPNGDAADDHAGRGNAGAADRVRERGQPAAGPRRRKKARDRDPRRHRRRPAAADRAATHRKSVAGLSAVERWGCCWLTQEIACSRSR